MERKDADVGQIILLNSEVRILIDKSSIPPTGILVISSDFSGATEEKLIAKLKHKPFLIKWFSIQNL